MAGRTPCISPVCRCDHPRCPAWCQRVLVRKQRGAFKLVSVCYTSVVMSTDPEPSARDRRHHFRITVVLPANIQLETDIGESALTEQSINIRDRKSVV